MLHTFIGKVNLKLEHRFSLLWKCFIPSENNEREKQGKSNIWYNQPAPGYLVNGIAIGLWQNTHRQMLLCSSTAVHCTHSEMEWIFYISAGKKCFLCMWSQNGP